MEQSYVNGRRIEHLDVIMHNVDGVKLDFKSRIKILFGIPFSVNTRIYTMHQHCNTVAGETSFSVKDTIITSQKIKAIYEKWHSSIYRLLLAFVSCFYMGYALLFDDPGKHLFFIKAIGFLAILKAIDFLIEFYLKWLLNKLSNKNVQTPKE